MSAVPTVSVIVPCRNEARFIGTCLTSIAASDFPKHELEVIVVDGMSDDETRAIIAEHAAADPTIVCLDNPDRIVPSAMNIGIRRASGRIIVRLDAHARYPRDYVSKLVEWLEKSGADNVGGVCVTRPANRSAEAQAIAIGLSHPFGVGNAHFRIGAREPRWIDTVPFGCYRREVFDRIGVFDEDLVRNQDDEFNARLVRNGGRILLVPEIRSEYFGRESLGKLWRMYYQYGYFKPLVIRKLGTIMTVRQVLPGLVVAGLIGGPLVAVWVAALRAPVAAAIAAYAGADIACAIGAAWRHGLRCALWLALVFPVQHVSYGLGFWKGALDFLVLRRPNVKGVRTIAPSR